MDFEKIQIFKSTYFPIYIMNPSETRSPFATPIKQQGNQYRIPSHFSPNDLKERDFMNRRSSPLQQLQQDNSNRSPYNNDLSPSIENSTERLVLNKEDPAVSSTKNEKFHFGVWFHPSLNNIWVNQYTFEDKNFGIYNFLSLVLYVYYKCTWETKICQSLSKHLTATKALTINLKKGYFYVDRIIFTLLILNLSLNLLKFLLSGNAENTRSASYSPKQSSSIEFFVKNSKEVTANQKRNFIKDLVSTEVKPPRHSPVKSPRKTLSETPNILSQRKVASSPLSKQNVSTSINKFIQQTPLKSPSVFTVFVGASPSSDNKPITDQRELENLFAESEPQMLPHATYQDKQKENSFFNTIAQFASKNATNLPKFMSAKRLNSGIVIKERVEGGLVVKDPSDVLKELNIHDVIDEWTEGIRRWLSLKVIVPLSKRIEVVDSEFKANNISEFNCLHCCTGLVSSTTSNSSISPTKHPAASSLFGVGNALAPKSSLFGSSQAQMPANQTNAKIGSFSELAQRYFHLPVVQERFKLENYLCVFDSSCRGYIVNRINDLAQGGCLSSFNWNSGGSYLNRPFNSDLFPTDAQLLMSLFCTFLDASMPGENSAMLGSHPFLSKYFLSVDSKPDPSKSIQIRHYSKLPPHYNLVVEGKTIWDVYPKRNNVFQVIAIFCHYIRVTSNGYLGMLNLGGKSLNLLDTIYFSRPGSRFNTMFDLKTKTS
ncbi:hypothetical protein HDU92_007174 [Lobulomyces angularis]|nr:hypothetical protein HDU92_007174 [Lobulomyces angularis]